MTIDVRVPAGITLGGQVRFKHRTFRCRREGERMIFEEAIFH